MHRSRSVHTGRRFRLSKGSAPSFLHRLTIEISMKWDQVIYYEKNTLPEARWIKGTELSSSGPAAQAAAAGSSSGRKQQQQEAAATSSRQQAAGSGRQQAASSKGSKGSKGSSRSRQQGQQGHKAQQPQPQPQPIKTQHVFAVACSCLLDPFQAICLRPKAQSSLSLCRLSKAKNKLSIGKSFPMYFFPTTRHQSTCRPNVHETFSTKTHCASTPTLSSNVASNVPTCFSTLNTNVIASLFTLQIYYLTVQLLLFYPYGCGFPKFVVDLHPV